MKLNRREILEQLVRLGIKDFYSLKHGCREFEAYWENIRKQWKHGVGTYGAKEHA